MATEESQMRVMILLAALASSVVPVAWGASESAPASGREWNFRVLLDGKEVGWHRYAVRGDGEATEVESRAQFDVRVLLVNAYRYRHEARERWRGACLDGLEARTETNGEVDEVEATARGDALVVAGPAGDARHAGCASHLLNSQTGELLPVRIADRGTELVHVSGRSVSAARHRLSAPGLQIDLWYADGRWIALEAPTPSGRVLRYELR
jgi:Family of unknown function (DUF6134)